MRIGEVTKKSDLIPTLQNLADRRLELRRPYDEIWWNNIALVAGEHYRTWDAGMGRYVEKKKPKHKVRMAINHAMTVVRTEFSRLTKSRPITEVVPQSDQMEDIAAAKVSKKALESAEWRFKLARKRKEALWWTLVTSTSAVYVGWDPENRDDGTFGYMIDPLTNEPTFSKARQDQLKEMVESGELEEDELQAKEEPLGDLDFRVYSPFQLLPDETALNWNDIRDLITIDVWDVDAANANWGVKLEPDQGALGTVEDRAIGRLGLSAHQPEKAVKIYTYWLLPDTYNTPLLENGLMIRWANTNVEVEYTDVFPFADERIPFAFFEHIPSTAAIWSDGIVRHIRDANLELDKTVSQLIENKDYMANPIWIVPTQCQVVGDIHNVPGSTIKYVAVPNIPPPTRIDGVPMPAQVENLVAALRDQILDISGQGETSRGRVPSGVRSGVAVAYLQEEDETRLGPTVENFEEAVSQMASLILARYSQYYITDRMLRMYKRDGEFDVFKFKGADLKNNVDVIVMAGSALPKSKAARQANVLELINMGIERDPKRIRDMLELGQGEPDDVDKSYAQATRENQAMVQGILTGSMSKFYQAASPQAVGVEGEALAQGNGQVQPTPDAEMGMMEPGMQEPSALPDELQPEGAAPMPGEMAGLPGDFEGGSPLERVARGMMEEPEASLTGEQAPSDDAKRGPVAIPVKKWHNHKAHLERHYSFMMDEEFERMAVNHPEIVRLFDEHTGMHEQVLSEQRNAELEALMAQRGAPGQSGEGAISPTPEGQPDMLLNEADLRAEATQ
jgi:hypothetical protein